MTNESLDGKRKIEVFFLLSMRLFKLLSLKFRLVSLCTRTQKSHYRHCYETSFLFDNLMVVNCFKYGFNLINKTSPGLI